MICYIMIKYLMLATMLLTAPPTKLGDDGCKQIESGYESSSEDIESDDDCPPNVAATQAVLN